MRKEHYLMQFFSFTHLKPELKEISAPFANLARLMDDTLPDNPEKVTALRKLLEAKDCAVRARLFRPDGGVVKHAAVSPGPVNCNIRLHYQGKRVPVPCERCGGSTAKPRECPFFTQDGESRMEV